MSGLRRAGDLAHTRTAGYRRRLDDTRRLVEQTMDGGYVSVSWGKDSTALLSVAVEINPTVRVLHYRWPDCRRPSDLDRVRDECLTRWPTVTYLELPLEGQTQAWDELGYAFLDPTTRGEREALDRALRTAGCRFRAALADLGCDSCMLGLRAGESTGRRYHAARRGRRYWSSRWGQWMVLPIVWWTDRDVWARHAEADLPSAAHYHHPLADRGTARSEITFAAARESWSHGEGGFWAHADPELWLRLTTTYPDTAGW